MKASHFFEKEVTKLIAHYLDYICFSKQNMQIDRGGGSWYHGRLSRVKKCFFAVTFGKPAVSGWLGGEHA